LFYRRLFEIDPPSAHVQGRHDEQRRKLMQMLTAAVKGSIISIGWSPVLRISAAALATASATTLRHGGRGAALDARKGDSARRLRQKRERRGPPCGVLASTMKIAAAQKVAAV
jgi:hypothetical protein